MPVPAAKSGHPCARAGNEFSGPDAWPVRIGSVARLEIPLGAHCFGNTLAQAVEPKSVHGVVLHLRFRYVSKAAIFRTPAPPWADRKSKSRLNSKGLDR